MLSRVLGMVRDMTFAFFLGASGLMDSWVLAFMIPNLARRLFGEGAASSSFIPVYSRELQKDSRSAKKLALTVVTVIFVLLTAAVVFSELLIWSYYKFFSVHPSTDLKLALTGTMLPYMILVCVVAILGGILNAHFHFAAPAAAPIVLNIFIISALCVSGFVFKIQPRRQVFIVAGAVLLAGLTQVALQLGPLRAKGIRLRPAWDVHSAGFKSIVSLMAPMIIGLTATQLNTLADIVIATWLSGSPDKGQFFSFFGTVIQYPLWEGAVSQLFYSQRLYQFPLGVLGISLATAIYPVMSSDAATKDMGRLCKTASQGLKSAVFIALPASAGLILVARALVGSIFEAGRFTRADTNLTAVVLSFYAFGLCGFFMQQIVIRAFYSLQQSKAPAKSAIVAVFVNIVLNLTLIWFLQAAGLALSTALCSYLQVIILITLLKRRLGHSLLKGFAATFLKTAAATCIMCIAAAGVMYIFRNLPQARMSSILRLLVVVPVCVATFIAFAKLLGIKELSLLIGRGRTAQMEQ